MSWKLQKYTLSAPTLYSTHFSYSITDQPTIIKNRVFVNCLKWIASRWQQRMHSNKWTVSVDLLHLRCITELIILSDSIDRIWLFGEQLRRRTQQIVWIQAIVRTNSKNCGFRLSRCLKRWWMPWTLPQFTLQVRMKRDGKREGEMVRAQLTMRWFHFK